MSTKPKTAGPIRPANEIAREQWRRDARDAYRLAKLVVKNFDGGVLYPHECNLLYRAKQLIARLESQK
jgi:hypothetical protein